MFSPRFQQALGYAAHLHARQLRKGSRTPYIAHLLGVCSLVIEDGGGEDEAIAALLHDAVEDQGGLAILEEIRSRFGARVAEIVDGCSDSYGNPKPAWRERKERYLEHLSQADPGVLRVSLADKLHNARSILRDLQVHKGSVWSRFRGGKGGTLWYYQALVSAFQRLYPGWMARELERVVAEILRLAPDEAGL